MKQPVWISNGPYRTTPLPYFPPPKPPKMNLTQVLPKYASTPTRV
jgi:hypothetical protein